MKRFFIIAAALLAGAMAFAQETNKDANGKCQYGPYETNKFWDNWFVQVGAGINRAQDKLFNEGFSGMTKGMGLDLEVAVGKWIDPCYGVRLGYQGVTNGNPNADPSEFGDIKFNYLHGDFMVNVSNLFAGYKEKRIVSFVPYLTAGGVFNKGLAYSEDPTENRSLALGAGLQVPIRLGGVVSLIPQFQYIGFRGVVVSPESPNGIAGSWSASLGLNFNLGKNNWTRKATTLAAAAAALAASEAAANAYKANADKLAADAAAAAAAKDALLKDNDALRKALADAEKDKGVMAADLAENPIFAYFEIGKTKLTEKELAHVDYNVKTALAQNKDAKLVISGNADSKTGTKKRNAYLAQKRAEYLFNLLTEKYGLNPDNFTVKSNGANDIFDIPALNRAAIISK